MVTAQLPFEGDTLYSLMMQHVEGTVRPPHELVPELHIPESLSRVILKSIDKAREQRFQTAEEFIAALDQVANDQAAKVPAPSDEFSSDQIAPIDATSLFRGSQASPVPTKTGPSVAADGMTPPLSTAAPMAVPIAAPASAARSVSTAPPADSLLVQSAAQHLFLQPRTFRLKHFLLLMALGLAAVLVAGVGYLKYQSWRRLTIESAVTEKLNNAPSPTLRQAHTKRICIGHSWSNPRRKSPESRGFSGGTRSGGFGSRRHPCDQSSRVSRFHSGGDFLSGSSRHSRRIR
jgi:hypothetical protein